MPELGLQSFSLEHKEMGCPEQQMRLKDEINAWAAYHYLKEYGGTDQEELTRRYNNACDISSRLKQHIAMYTDCRPKTDEIL